MTVTSTGQAVKKTANWINSFSLRRQPMRSVRNVGHHARSASATRTTVQLAARPSLRPIILMMLCRWRTMLNIQAQWLIVGSIN